jgi:hypothetical protein
VGATTTPIGPSPGFYSNKHKYNRCNIREVSNLKKEKKKEHNINKEKRNKK